MDSTQRVRPIMTASQPVCATMAAASSGERTSPLPITGIFTASFSAAIHSQLRLSAVTLLAGASVQRDCSESTFLRHLGELDVDDFLVAPSGAELHRERNLHRSAYRLEDVLMSGRSRSRPEPPLHFTTFFAGQPRFRSTRSKPRSSTTRAASASDCGIAAKQLRRDRVLVAVEREVLLGLLVLVAHDAVGRGELGHHQAAAAQVADEAAEHGVGYASHGREHGRRTDFDSARATRWQARGRSGGAIRSAGLSKNLCTRKIVARPGKASSRGSGG